MAILHRDTLFGCGLPLLMLGVSVGPAQAQRVEENAVAAATDAFGKSIGNERTGLYNSEDVRGFSPTDAGNTRIAGLYFDQVDRLSQRLQKSSTVHVGISALNYPFPAPTGIVDQDLTDATGPFTANLYGEYGDFGGFRANVEVQVPLVTDRLGLAAGVGLRHQGKPEGGTSNFHNFGVVSTWQPYQNAEITLFGGGIFGRDDEARPVLFPVGSQLPPQIPRGVFLGQDWAARASNIKNSGLIIRLPLGGIKLESGLFHSLRETSITHADLLTGVTADGRAADRTIIADGNNLDDAWSGEVRLTRQWQKGELAQRLTLSARGRLRKRLFGGTQRISLGPSFADRPDQRPAPAIVLGKENDDRVRQYAFGASYDLSWGGHGTLEASLSKINYRKRVDFADPLRADVESRDSPLVWNISASVILSKRLALYAGYVTGLEDAPIAPDIAANRSEAPPSIRTRQVDAGLRFAVTPKLSLVAGLFSVRKPYFNLDTGQRFRELGQVESRGVELSLAGQVRPGISLVLGTVLIDPRISGELVASGAIGKRPVASLTRRSIANLDWRLGGGKSPFSFDLDVESLSARTANSANTLEAPPRTRINLGARYRFNLLGTKALIRAQVQNIFNAYGWNVQSSGGFTYTDGRNGVVQLVIEL